MGQVTNIYIDITELTGGQLYLVNTVFASLSKSGTYYDLSKDYYTEMNPIWTLDKDGDRMNYKNLEEMLESVYSRACESISYGTILEYTVLLRLTSENTAEQESIEQETVDKPNHYQLLPEYQVRDINKAILDKVQESTFDMSLDEAGWFQQAMQYFMRFYAKNGVEDLEKGVYAMSIVIESLKGEK